MNNVRGLVTALASDLWAMEEAKLAAFFEKLGALGLPDAAHVVNGQELGQLKHVFWSGTTIQSEPHAGLFDEDGPRSRMSVAEGVATIPITGTLMKAVPKILRWFGIDATSYKDLQEDLAKANADPVVQAIRLLIDSPGGQVAGVKEAADAIAGSEKPVFAEVTDLAASAAYWLAAQAKKIAASPNALIGSIGVFSVHTDSSRLAENLGLKVHVVSSGPHKGMGVPGAPITDEQLAAQKELILGMAANFKGDVARGRRRTAEEIDGWATGQVWLAEEAKKRGLIDGITTQKAAAAHVGTAANLGAPSGASSAPEEEETAMTEQELAAAKAKAGEEARTAERKRAADIKAAFPRHTEFALAQIEAGATLIEAKAAFADVLRAEAEARELEARKPAPAPGASAAVGSGKPSPATDGASFMALVDERMKVNGGNKLEAMSYCAGKHRQLYREWEAAADAKALARKEGSAK